MVPKCKKYMWRKCHSLNCHIVSAIYQRCNSYSATCVSYQLALNSYRNRYKLVLFYHQFIYFSEYIYIYWPNPVTAKIFQCHICVTCHRNDTLSRIPQNPYYGSLVRAYFGLLSKFSSFFSLFYAEFNLSTKCVGGALCHDITLCNLCVWLVNKL